MTFNNQDAGIPHNFSVYTDQSAANMVFRGGVVTGPGKETYSFKAPTSPGNYWYQCDIHPLSMTGTLTVTAP